MKTLKEMHGDWIEVKPANADWSTGYGETWESYEAHRCEKCGAAVVNSRGDRHCDIDQETECDGYCGTSEGPMMNYYYPLPDYRGEVNDDAMALVGLPLCVVHFTDRDEYALALTGGGMDLSWEICEAFMRLGGLPPVHFANLPQMSGRGTSKRDRWIISGARKSAQIAKQRAGWTLRKLRQSFGKAKS